MRSVALIGFRGAGKSQVAAILARDFSMKLVDLDAEFERDVGVSIPAFVEIHGEEAFRSHETELLKAALQKSESSPHVVVTGGGVVERDVNRAALLAWPHFRVWLSVEEEELWSRLQGSAERLLVGGWENRDRFREAFLRRQPWYRTLATHTLANGSPPDNAAKIFEIMRDFQDPQSSVAGKSSAKKHDPC